MVNYVSLYNSLPWLGEANEKFTNRDQIFSKLARLFAAHGGAFGVCLAHRHCTLEEGEMMVATESVCQPERDTECYPASWLANGEPFEFNQKPCPSPPETLFEEFGRIVDGTDVLALFYVQDEQRLGKVFVERTEGRKNIVDIVPYDAEHTIATAWLPGHPNPTVFVCNVCVTTTDDKGKKVHTPTC
jgi:hypothetical protein